MHVAFYAPLKPPGHPTPSGDRTMARALIAALEGIGGVTEVSLVSDLRTRDGAGDAARQAQIVAEAEAEIDRLSSRRWDAWITYHTYYKAPDLLGPRLAAERGIPYIQVEASRAPRRLQGAWADFAARAEAATDAADWVLYLTERDRPALEAARPDRQKLAHLPPFLNRDSLPAAKPPVTAPHLLAVAMLRHGDKTDSFRALAAALAHLRGDWRLTVLGDGPARAEVETMFRRFGQHVRFRGQVDPSEVEEIMAGAACLVWPGVNEAFGMVYLEAQALGLRAVAEDRPGVRDVIGPTGALVPPGDAPGFARAIAALPRETPQTIETTRAFAAGHLRPQARAVLSRALGIAP